MDSWVVHFLIPRHTNNHRARALHIDALFFYVLAIALLRTGIHWGHRQFPDVLGYATNIHVQELLVDTNAKRQTVGLPPLSINEELSKAAAAKARDMFSKNYWAHNSPDGRTPWDFIIESGYTYTVAGENLAKNFSDSAGVVAAWMASPSHRDNLLKPSYRDIGFAVVNGTLNGEETTLVVQMFGAGSTLASAQPSALTPKALTANPSTGQTFGAIDQSTAGIAKTKPVVISDEALSATNIGKQYTSLPEFLSVIRRPLIDIAGASRQFVYIFIGFLLGVFIVDAWLVARHKVVRVAGHTTAHLLFFVSLLIATGSIMPGKIL